MAAFLSANMIFFILIIVMFSLPDTAPFYMFAGAFYRVRIIIYNDGMKKTNPRIGFHIIQIFFCSPALM
jgi:hypothetical protein